MSNTTYDNEPGRSVYRFDLSSIPSGSQVSSASFAQHVVGCAGSTTYYCNQYNYTVELHPFSAYWDPTTATFNTLASLMSSSVLDSVYQPAFTCSLDDGTPPCGHPMSWNNLAGAVQGWVNNPSTNYGFIAKLQTETLNEGGLYWSYHGPYSADPHPYLQVSYTPPTLAGSDTYGGGSPASDYHPCSTAQPVDCNSGGLWHTIDDISVPGRGMALHFTQTYNSSMAQVNGPPGLGQANGRLGYGWTDSYNMSLQVDALGNYVIHQENGSTASFTPGPGGTFAGNNVLGTLVRNGAGVYTFTRRAREIFTFSPYGQLLSESDLNGNTTTLAYNNAFQIATITDPAQRALSLSYYSSGLLYSVTDNAGRSVQFGYNDAYGDLTDIYDVNGGHTQFTYYPNTHLLYTMTDARQTGSVTNYYDSSNRVYQQTDQLQRRTLFDYTSIPGATKITDPAGNVTVEYYSNNMLSSLTKGYGTAGAATWNYQYDPATLGTSQIKDPNQHTTYQTFDSNGNLATTMDPLNRKTVQVWDSLNDLRSRTDGNHVTTTYTYDGNGNMTSASTPLLSASGVVLAQQVTQYCYYGDSSCGAPAGAAGDLYKMIDADGKASTYSYDAYGDRVTATDPLGHTATTCYNAIGWKIASYSAKAVGISCGTAPLASPYETTYSYVQPNGLTDEFGDVQAVTDPLGHSTKTTYDADRNVVSSTDGDGNPTTYTFDPANERTDVIRADQSDLHTDYNLDGTVHDQKDGKSNAIQTYAYDSLARVTSDTDALGNATQYTYDAAGNQLTKQDPGGTCSATPATGCTTMAYDAANELTGIAYSDGVTPNVNNITYDADGQRTAMTDGTGSSSWSWDSLRRLTAYTDGHGNQVQYQYNLRGLVTQLTYPGKGNVTRVYDDAGRLASVQDWLGNKTIFGYDANNNLTAETLPPGTNEVDTTGYNAADQLTSISDVGASVTVFGATYGRDGAGQLVSDSSLPAAVASDRYTSLNQLCYAGSSATTACASPPAGAKAYSYDAADNLTSDNGMTQSFNVADRLCWTLGGASSNPCGTAPAGATTYSYDTRGNRTAATPPAVPESYAYDQANRLTGVHATSSLAAVTGSDGGLYVKQDGGSFSGLGTSPGGAFSAAPAVVFIPVGNGQPPVPLYIGVSGDHRVWVRTTSLGWQSLSSSAACLDNVAAAVSGQVGSSTLTVACQGTDHALYYAQAAVTPTSLPSIANWTSLGGTLTAGPAVAVIGGTPTFFVTSGGGAVFYRTPTSSYQALGATCSGHPAVASQASTAYFACHGTDGALWYAVNGGSGWGAFQSAGGQIQDGPGIAATAASVTMFVTGTNGALYHTTIPVGGGAATPYVSDGGASLFGTGAAGYDASAAYAYNGDGLRTQKTLSSSGPSAHYTWDVSGGLPLLLQDGTNTYVYGPNGLPLEQVSTSGSVTYLHHDQLGSTRALTDATGTVVGTYTFDSYGNTVGQSGSTTTPLLYDGQYQDAESGLYYLRARYYDSATAQFLSRDPMAASTRAPYGYVGGNPLNATDPSGECGLWGSDTCLGDAAGWVNNHVIQPASNWVEHNFGTVATVAAAGVCIAASLGVCAGAVAVAFVARSAERWIYEGGSQSLGADALDAGTTVASFGLVGIPGAIGTGGAPAWMTTALGIGSQAEEESQAAFTLWQSLLAKGLLAAPDAVDLLLDLMQSGARSCR